jgi:hypothetical protein
MPEANERHVRDQMRVVVRLYWWMGAIGLGGYSVGAVVMTTAWIRRGAAFDVEFAMGSVFCVAAFAAFATSIYVARRLATNPHGLLPLARLVGIILATVWCPILTVPAVICVHRVTKYFAAYCNVVQTDRHRAAVANTA